MRHRRRLAALAALAALGLAGCGLGQGGTPAGATLTITEDFGTRPVRELEQPKASGEETVMRLLQRNAKVTTRYGGGFVQSIDGRSGGVAGGRPVDWFYYVNGVEAPKGAASTKLHAADRVWWDRHDWTATQRIPAVVGSFPEPFRHGLDGKRYPVRIECADPGVPACKAVQKALTDAGVPAAIGSLRAANTAETLRVVVGVWTALREDRALQGMERGPQASGVYARPAADGRRITLLDPRGRPTRTLGAGTGMVAATRVADDQPVWVVTGTDPAGVESAGRAFDEATLAHRFAVVVSQDLPISVPEAAAR
jgi:Domain of unknown function (DUF4430)